MRLTDRLIWTLVVVAGVAGLVWGQEAPLPPRNAAVVEMQRMREVMASVESFGVRITGREEVVVGGVGWRGRDVVELAVERPGGLRLEGVAGVDPWLVVSGPGEVAVVRPGRGEYMVLEGVEGGTEESEGKMPSAREEGSEGKMPSARGGVAGLLERPEVAGALLGAFPAMDLVLGAEPGEGFWRALEEGGEHLGEAFVDGESCNHIRWDQGELVLEFFVRADDRPVLRRVTAVMEQQMRRGPRETLAVSVRQEWQLDDWRLGAEFEEGVFVYEPGAGMVVVPDWQEFGGNGEGQHPLVGTEAAGFELERLGGGEVSLAGLKGQVVLLDFWASWCGPCRQALPEILAVAKEYGEKGLVFYGVNQGEDAATVRGFLERSGFEMAVLMDREGALAGRYGAQGIPHTVLIGKDGRIWAVHSGFVEGQGAEIAAEVERALAGGERARLVVESVEFGAVQAGRPTGVAIRLRNEGTAVAGAFEVVVEVEGMEVLRGPVEGLAAGASETVRFGGEDWGVLVKEAGSYGWSVVADPGGAVSGNGLEERTVRGEVMVEEKS